MKRNMKFLLLLAIFTSSIMAAYFITGCGDDSTVIEFPPDVTNDTTVIIEGTDKVIGTMHGTVRDGYDNSFLAGVTITWTNGDSVYSTTTDAGGKYSTPTDLPSGGYEFTFSMATYAITTSRDTIPDLDELRGDDHNVPAGDIYYSEVLDVWMLPMTGNIHGIVYTALPAPPNKDGEAVLALDDPRLVSVAGGVKVFLDYGFDIHPNKYPATTNADGSYEFINVPLWVGQYGGGEAGKEGQPVLALADDREVDLLTMPFTEGDSTFEGTIQENISMVPGAITYMPNVFAPLIGGNQVVTNKPVILTYTFETPGFTVTDSLVINFSKQMETATMEIVFLDGADTVDFLESWDALDMVLTMNPALSLVPDKSYTVKINGFAKDGLPLYQGPWQRDCETQQGMRFVATNLDDYGDVNNPFTDFPLDASITIDFDMDVDLLNPLGWVRLMDAGNNREVNADITALGATVTVDPSDSLKSNTTYELDFRLYSNLRGDFVDDDEIDGSDLEFTSFNAATEPGVPADFALNMGNNWLADFNTTMINFKWTAVSNAVYYEIYASDNMNNTDIIVVAGGIDHVDFLTAQGGSVDFTTDQNDDFDLYADDYIVIPGPLTVPLITPFSGGTEVTFQVRAVNSWGPGDFSATLTVADETAPGFTIDQSGNADNTNGSAAITFYIDIDGPFDDALNGSGDELEYVSTIAFDFLEAGGDPTGTLTSADIAWDWDLDMRDGAGVVTVPIDQCASRDSIQITITDNSGNDSTVTLALHPWIVIDDPNNLTDDFMAPDFLVEWTTEDDPGVYGDLNIWFSLDGGATWLDPDVNPDWAILGTTDDGDENFLVDDTLFSTNAMIAIQDQDLEGGGGWMWKSEIFTWAGLKLTAPDMVAWEDSTPVYDRGGTDSTGVPITFASAGLDSVVVVYSTTGVAGTYTNISDTILPVSEITNYTWYPENVGANYDCYLGLKYYDQDLAVEPFHLFDWKFDVIHDNVDLTAPLAGAAIGGGSDYDVTWTFVATATSKVGLQYSIDDGTNWITIVAETANDGSYTWPTPANTFANNTARIRIIDNITALNTLDEEGTFSISGLVVTAPVTGDEWLVGSGQDIGWTEHGTVGTISIYWSRDGFVDDSTLVIADAGAGPTFNWSVDANSACSTVTFRLFGKTATDTVYITSDEMTFSGVVVTSPISGNLAQGAGTTVTWETIGTQVGNSVDIEYKYITTGPPVETTGWLPLATTTNDGSWDWDPIPAPPAEQAWIRIKKAGTVTGGFEGAEFSISGLVVIAPNGSESWAVGTPHDITWNVINPVDVGNVTIALYKDPGAVLISTLAVGIDGALETWSWTVPGNQAYSTSYYIRIFADNAPTIFDVSNNFFEVPLDVTMTSPNGTEVWVLDSPVAINWTDNGVDAADPVQLEHSWDNGTSWAIITGAGALTNVNTFNWTLDDAVDGDLIASTICLVRVTTTAGPAATDVSDGNFTINPSIAVTAPVFGNTLTIDVAATKVITWDDMGLLAAQVKIEYTLDDGAAWLPVKDGGGTDAVNIAAGTNTFTWTLDPAVDAALAASVICKVRITAETGPTAVGMTGLFEIAVP